jgi:GxxExxY protein
MHTEEHRLNSVTRTVIGCAYQVSNTLGCGFLEKVYENALAHEIRKKGLLAQQQCQIQVFYDGTIVGEYVADLLVEKCVLVELKAAKTLENAHLAQCLNYLRGANLKLCLLINCETSKVQVKRISN